MNVRSTARRLVLAASLAAAAGAFAQPMPQSAEYYPFSEIMAMKMMDKNKDGMVSKKEFMDMMSMAWDMNAKKMGAKGDKMTPQQFNEVLMYLKAGS